jgi:LmbE family N-acetylglucosaminyl deacetylase
MRRLILAPHADDEVLGCGALLATRPDECAVLVMSDRGDGRQAEFQRARAVLGYQRFWYRGDIATGSLQSRMREVTSYLDQVMWDYQPDVLYVPFPSLHQDHIALYEAGLRSARLGFAAHHWYPPSVLAYDVSAYPVNLYQTPLTWNVFLGFDEAAMVSKEQAFAAYESQNDASRPSTLRDEARALGGAHRLPYAERFALVREVVA